MRSVKTNEMSSLNPFVHFRQWYREAFDAGIPEPGTMTLATSDAEGRPSARIVLLKDFDEKGFVFFTNYRSRKGMHLDRNPWAALVVYWQQSGRQVRIEGRVVKVPAGESDRYFATRPRGSQLGAWASEQSSTIPSRESLEASLRERDLEFRDREVPRPPHWGGYRLIPDRMEFWVEREDRLHDRLVYERSSTWNSGGITPEDSGVTTRGNSGKTVPGNETGDWVCRRLAP
jgi:pyridoxamine 5'-phosphate oxidase